MVLELGAGETATATELARRHPMSRQAIAKHLAVLEEAGLVTHARHGRETRYALDAAPLGDGGELAGDRRGHLGRPAGPPGPRRAARA